MNAWQIAILVGAGVLAFWAVGASQRLLRLRATIQSCFQLVDAQLRRQDDALAALDAVLREQRAALPPQVLAASRQALAAAALLREAAHQSGRARGLTMAEQVLASAIATARPGLQSQAQDQAALQPALEALQAATHQLDLARESFDQAVQAYNAAVHQFPTRLLAALSGFGRAGRLQPPEHAAEHEPQRVQS
ncbi:MAG: hypothetical protein EPO12_18650 [Aquabacterium sp.]|nr:MAG: hypothetical protein EPO12_18650 [Aquabacterium sp.]